MKQTPLRKVGKKRQAEIDAGTYVKPPRSPIGKGTKAAPKIVKAKVKVRPLSAIKSEADRAAAAFCKSLGRCEAANWVGPDGSTCRCSDRLEWAHVKSRGQLFLRHNPRNALALCSAHHRRFTEHPDAWYRFVEDVRPGTWDYLNAQTRDRRDTKVKTPLRDVFQGWIEFYKGVENH